MALLLNTHFHLAVDNLRRNRGRTFLSALGIAIGVASIVLILSLTGGINQLISANSDKNNADLILVRPSTGKDVTENIISELTSNNQFIKSSLVLQDIDTISKIDGVASVAPIAASTGAIKIGDRTVQGANIVATNTSFIDVMSLHLKNGQFLDTTSISWLLAYWIKLTILSILTASTLINLFLSILTMQVLSNHQFKFNKSTSAPLQPMLSKKLPQKSRKNFPNQKMAIKRSLLSLAQKTSIQPAHFFPSYQAC